VFDLLKCETMFG